MAETGQPERPPDFWERVQFDYEANEITVAAMCEKHGLTASQVNDAARRGDWMRRRKTPQVNRKEIIKRLFRLLNRALEQLEKDKDRLMSETEMTVLSRLVHSMGKLIDIEAQAAGPNASPRETREMHDIRRKLVERIEELKRQ